MKIQIRKVLNILLIIGLIDTLYLSWLRLTQTEAQCVQIIGDCGSVTTSRFSELLGIPVAYIGLAGYLTLLILNNRSPFWIINKAILEYTRFALSLFGFILSIYLTYIQFAVLKSFCPYCLFSALIMTITFAISVSSINLQKSELK